MTKNSPSEIITRYFIQSPLTPLLLIALFVMGIMALIAIPREEEPQISVPMIDIFVQADGLKAQDAQELITKPLESIVKAIQGVEHIYAQTVDDRVMITVRFFVNSNADDALLRVHDRIRAHLSEIPYAIPMPIIQGKSIDDVAVMVLTFAPHAQAAHRWNDTRLYELALRVQEALLKTPDMGSTYLIGGRPQQLRIELKPDQLAFYGLTVNQVVQKMTQADSSLVAGSIRGYHAMLTLLAGSTFQSTTDLGRTLLYTFDDRPVYLHDIATLSLEGKPLEHRVWFCSPHKTNLRQLTPAVSLALAKRPGSNAVTLSDNVHQRLQMLKGHLIPDDVEVTITRDYGQTAREKSNHLLRDLMGATLAVIFLISLAIGWREGVMVLCVIPATVLATIFVSWVCGFTLNRVSLFALIFSIGILVDDAIVFTENIVRRWRDSPQSHPIETAIQAVVEVGSPTIIATVTIVLALLPMLFVRGLMGPYMSPIPIHASIAMMLSLIIAFTVVPWFILKLRSSSSLQAPSHPSYTEHLSSFYRRMATPIITHPHRCALFLLFTILATFLACGLFFTKDVIVKMLPFDNKSEMIVQADLPEGAALEETERTLRLIVSALDGLPELQDLQLYAGIGAPFNFNGLVRHSYVRKRPELGEIQINLTPKSKRNRTSHEIALEVRQRLKNLSTRTGTVIKVLEVPPGPPVLSTLLAEVYGPTPEARRALAEKIKTAFNHVPFITDIDDSYGTTPLRLRVLIEPEKLHSYQVTEQEIYTTLKHVLHGTQIGYAHKGKGSRPIEIAVELPPQAKRLSNTHFWATPVATKTGETVEIGELVTLHEEPASYALFRHNGYDVEMVMAELSGAYEAPLYGMMAVDTILKTMDGGEHPPQRFYGQPQDESQPSLLWDGEWEITYVTFRDMGAAFLVALLCIYALLVAHFKSFRTPAVVLIPVPLVLLGILLGHWLIRVTFTATSMIGMIALAGIVVRNSLLLVEFIRHQRGMGVPLEAALIEAGSIRMTPILLTALAAMMGALFMFSDPIFEGLATALFFGLMSSTLLTLIAIPAVYVVAQHIQNRRALRLIASGS